MGSHTPAGLCRSRDLPNLRSVAGQIVSALRVSAVLVWAVVRWTYRHLRWVVGVAGIAFALRLLPAGQPVAIQLLILGWIAPAVVAVVWARWWPASYERWAAGPLKRALR